MKVVDLLSEWPIWQNANQILFYWALKDEINLSNLIAESLLAGKQCFIPKIFDGFEGGFSQIFDCSTGNLNKSSCGTLESYLEEYMTDFSSLDLVFVPGLIFDSQGFRLGRGKGFYDRLLTRLSPETVTVGIIPEALFLEKLFCLDEWDKSVKFIATEKFLKKTFI